jgi:HK97 family phage major capsid protein
MKELYEVRRQHRDTLDKAQALLEKVQADGREMTSAEETSYNGWLQMADRFQKKAEHLEALDNRMRTLPADEGQVISSFDGLGSPSPTAKTSEWMDEKGNPVKVYSHNEKMGTGALSVGKFMRGALTGNWQGAEAEHRIFATTTTNLSSGGYAIPQYLHKELIDLARAKSVLSAAGARVVDLQAASNKILRVTADPTAEVKVELEAFNASNATFDLVEFTPWTIGTYVQISKELAEDGQNFAQILEQVMSAVVAAKLDYLGLRGAGSTEPTGITNTANINTVDVSSWTYDVVLDSLSELQQDNCDSSNAYIVSPATNNTLVKLKDLQGNYLTVPDDVKTLSKYVTTSMQDSDMIVGDFSNLYLGLRSGLSFEFSPVAYDSFQKYALAFRVVLRADWQVVRPSHFCLASQNVS